MVPIRSWSDAVEIEYVWANMVNSYDEIAYPSGAFRPTHPDGLAAQGAVFGLETAPPETSRVLEIGAGDGSNLIPMAINHPGATFVGFDLAALPVQRGVEAIKAMGLKNVRLIQADIMDVDLGPESFDYIIAHGVYSWVPSPVRDGLVRLVGRCLAPQGVGFISYLTLPGCYLRMAIREELLSGVSDIVDRTARIEAALIRLKAWPQSAEIAGLFPRAIAEEAANIAERSTVGVLAHDELNDFYHPVYIEDFRIHCGCHDLQILGEAEQTEIEEWIAPEGGADETGFDPVARARHADFARGRFFRQSLVARAGAPISRVPRPEHIAGLHVSSFARPKEGVRFECGALAFDLNDPPLVAALARLAAAWPATLPMGGLMPDPARQIALVRLAGMGALELHGAPSNFRMTAGDRPAASPMARLQAARGDGRLTTLRHTMMNVDDDFTRGFIAGLDGARTRQELARDLASRFNLPAEGAMQRLGVILDALARAPLIVQ
jgi:2-polyprenyl-3-methyl-5-hydroxy-6-metoxy-1,4-benzoquinol methylase